MRKIILFLLLILLNSELNAQSGWNITTIDLTINFTDVKFFNSMTGVVGSNYGVHKTTNGGTNWYINITQLSNYFICSPNIIYSTYYIGGFPPSAGIKRTTNSGLNWTNIASTGYSSVSNFYFIDEYTGWATTSDLLYRTENGINFTTNSLPVSPGGTNSIYFTTPNTGYFYGSNKYLYKSINKGISWVLHGVPDMYMRNYSFTDTSTIYMCGYYSNENSGLIKKSINGGLNWNTILSTDSIAIHRMCFVNSLTGYAIANHKFIYRTSNGGINWSIQIPDTSSLCSLNSISFINPYTGWIVGNYGKVYYTPNGGSVFISNLSSEAPSKYSLGQNYPNPFNPISNIKYKISKSSNVRITVYDVRGKEVETLVNEKHSPGEYLVSFDGSMLTSGLYFYRMETDGITVTKKMVLIK